MMLRKKGVITGATGYIGSNLARYLLSEGWDVSIIVQIEFGYDNIEDIKDKIDIIEYDGNIQTLISFFRKNNPDIVYHLAAAVITNYKPEQIATLIQSNIQFGTEVLEAMSHSNTKLFIGTGSYWQNYNSEVYNPVDLYAATKEAFEKIIQFYVDAHSFRAITLRLFDIYGEDDKRPKLLNLLAKSIKNKSHLDISPGEQWIDLVHISDICSAYLKAYELLITNISIQNHIFGVYTGKRIQLKNLINLFEEITQTKLNVNIGGKSYKTREVMKPCSSYPRLPNWKPNISLREGIIKLLSQK